MNKEKYVCNTLLYATVPHYNTTLLQLYGGRTEARWYKTAGTLVRGSTKQQYTPPNRIADMNTLYMQKKEEADFLTTEERGSAKKKNILNDATLNNKLKNQSLENTCILVRSRTPLLMLQQYYIYFNVNIRKHIGCVYNIYYNM